MFEFLNKLLQKKQLTEQQKISIIELIDKEESFINPRDLMTGKSQPKKYEERKWLNYITPYMRMNNEFTPQVEHEIDALFNKMCDFIDVELKKKHKSIKRVKSEYSYYRESIFDEVYRFAKSLVCSFYRQENKEPADFISYMLESMLSGNIRVLLIKEMDKYREELPFPNEETRVQFRLTSFGTKIIWWDPVGKLRNEQIFDSTEMNYFNKLSKRASKFAEVPALMTFSLNKYTDLLHIILEDLEDETIRWKIKPTNYFRDYFQLPLYDSRIWNETKRLTADLYLLAENSIRQEVEGFRLLAAEESQENLKKYLPNETIQKIQDYLDQKTVLEFDYPTVLSLRAVYKTAWNETANFIVDQPIEIVSELLEEIAKDPDLKKIATKVIKTSNDLDKHRLFIFLMEMRTFPLSKEIKKQRDSFIHVTRQEDYQNLLVDKELTYGKLLITLKELRQPIRRKIKLNNELITASNSALYTIIDMVDDYLGGEDGKPDSASNDLFHQEIAGIAQQVEPMKAVDSSVLTTEKGQEVEQPVNQMAFFKHLVLNNGMSLAEFKKQAASKGKLYQAYLSELNEILYEVFDDQVLEIQQQQVRIEDDFMEEMREWIDG